MEVCRLLGPAATAVGRVPGPAAPAREPARIRRVVPPLRAAATRAVEDAMPTVSLARVPEIVQGAGALETLGQTLSGRVPRGSPVLLVADPGLKASGFADAAAAALGGAGFAVLAFSDVKSDPTMAQVDAAVALARR